MTPEQADALAGAAAAYVHIPFCSAVCPYCDFAVVAGKDHLARRYVDAVCAEISRSDRWRPLDAVYLGGGTPSHVDPGLLVQVLDALSSRHGITDNAEISLEANPEDVSSKRARNWLAIGFNRISFGGQSFDRSVLAALGRRHLADDNDQAVRCAREARFVNVSVDLIYGAPVETEASWERTLGRLVAISPDHVSCYALTVEQGTPLARAVRDGAAAPDPDVQADRFEAADTILGQSGYIRYEVSNWARPGRECRYNSIVWAQGEYEAYGNGAHGFRSGHRFRNLRRVDAYMEAVESGSSPRAGEEPVAGWGAEIDRLFVGLRRAIGVADGPGVRALLESDDGNRLVEAGAIRYENGRLRVVRPLLTDEVHRAVLGLGAPPDGWAQSASADIVSVSADA